MLNTKHEHRQVPPTMSAKRPRPDKPNGNAALPPPGKGRKRCRECGGILHASARKCKHCNFELHAPLQVKRAQSATASGGAYSSSSVAPKTRRSNSAGGNLAGGGRGGGGLGRGYGRGRGGGGGGGGGVRPTFATHYRSRFTQHRAAGRSASSDATSSGAGSGADNSGGMSAGANGGTSEDTSTAAASSTPAAITANTAITAAATAAASGVEELPLPPVNELRLRATIRSRLQARVAFEGTTGESVECRERKEGDTETEERVCMCGRERSPPCRVPFVVCRVCICIAC